MMLAVFLNPCELPLQPFGRQHGALASADASRRDAPSCDVDVAVLVTSEGLPVGVLPPASADEATTAAATVLGALPAGLLSQLGIRATTTSWQTRPDVGNPAVDAALSRLALYRGFVQRAATRAADCDDAASPQVEELERVLVLLDLPAAALSATATASTNTAHQRRATAAFDLDANSVFCDGHSWPRFLGGSEAAARVARNALRAAAAAVGEAAAECIAQRPQLVVKPRDQRQSHEQQPWPAGAARVAPGAALSSCAGPLAALVLASSRSGPSPTAAGATTPSAMEVALQALMRSRGPGGGGGGAAPSGPPQRQHVESALRLALREACAPGSTTTLPVP